MKKPFGINLMTFISVFQIMFSGMTLLVLMFILGMSVEVGTEAYEFKQMLSISLFNRPFEALTLVHYSIVVIGTLLPAMILMLVLRMIKSRNLKVVKSLFIIKLVLDLLRLSILNIIIGIMMILVLYKEKQTIRYFNEEFEEKV